MVNISQPVDTVFHVEGVNRYLTLSYKFQIQVCYTHCIDCVCQVATGIAVTTVINMLRSARRRREFVYYQIKPPSYNI